MRILFSIFFLLLMGATCGGSKSLQKSNNADFQIDKSLLINDWRHSQEERKGDTLTYRNAGFKFPKTRGRTGFLIKEDWSVIYHDIARNDLPLEVNCKAVLEGKNLTLTSVNNSKKPYKFEVISVAKDLMKVRRR